MLFLASQSPRRRDLLQLLDVRFDILDPQVLEQRLSGESPVDYVRRIAREKAGAGLLLVAERPGAWVLAADTEVILDDRVFGKPKDADDAAAMLRSLSGRTHTVLSSVWLLSAENEWQALSVSKVTIEPLSDSRIAAYVASGECFGKAGAYAIQGRAAAFVSHLDGSHSGVMGLPLHETATLLRRAGLVP